MTSFGIWTGPQTKQIDVKHHLMRDACDVGEIRVVNARPEDQHTNLCTKPLDMQISYKHAKAVLNIV